MRRHEPGSLVDSDFRSESQRRTNKGPPSIPRVGCATQIVGDRTTPESAKVTVALDPNRTWSEENLQSDLLLSVSGESDNPPEPRCAQNRDRCRRCHRVSEIKSLPS